LPIIVGKKEDYVCSTVINELRLDMSLSVHRKDLKKQEKIFFGLFGTRRSNSKNQNNQNPLL
jgi:hypothetical protein